HRVLIPNRPVQAGDEVEVGFFTGRGWTEFEPVARTRSWDWQLGSMLQWVGDSGALVFNDFEDDHHVARVVSPDGGAARTLHVPIVALSPDGAHAANYDFARVHHAMPGYGYAIGTRERPADVGGSEGSLRIVDVATGATTELYSLQDMIDVDHHPSMDGA